MVPATIRCNGCFGWISLHERKDERKKCERKGETKDVERARRKEGGERTKEVRKKERKKAKAKPAFVSHRLLSFRLCLSFSFLISLLDCTVLILIINILTLLYFIL